MPPATPPARRPPIHYTSRAPRTTMVVIHGQAARLAGDAYYALVTAPLWKFAAAVAGIVLAVNAIFAELFRLSPGCVSNVRADSFEDAFFFSVQTLATIGYGTMVPLTRYAHVVVTIESILGILAVGSLAGVAFARLSRPKARVLFAEKIVVRPRDGVPHMQFRIANWRTNLIVEAQLKIFLLVAHTTAEGELHRVPVEVKLLRAFSPVFFLTWTAMHVIDEQSPFYGGREKLAQMKATGVQMFASLTGYDQSLGQNVHAYVQFMLDDIVYDAAFADIITIHDDGRREIDFSRFHDIVTLDPRTDPPKDSRASDVA